MAKRHENQQQTCLEDSPCPSSREGGWGWGGRERGLGEDQGPVTWPLHAVKCLSAGLSVTVSLEEKKKSHHEEICLNPVFLNYAQKYTYLYICCRGEFSFNLHIWTICCL